MSLLETISALGAAYQLPADWLQQRPHLFSPATISLSATHAQTIKDSITAIETVIATSTYQQKALTIAPPIAQKNPGNPGVFFGYDFHLTPGGPQLIEINTNAGGAFLSALLQQAYSTNPDILATWEKHFIAMFLNEWRIKHDDKPLKRIAIIDETPEQQYLYPEMLLFQQLFRRHGIDTILVDPGALRIRQQTLYAENLPIDLVYNRLTDFYLTTPAYATLQQAYQQDSIVLTPHPHAHALYANKRNLIDLSDQALLKSWRVDEHTCQILHHTIPTTFSINSLTATELWEMRKQLFFKPISGYGSKGVYRGDKLTHRVFNDILAADYIAQTWVAPSEHVIAGQAFKVDIRAYAYAGEVQGLVARLYQGQTTNFRTVSGGFGVVKVG